MLLNTAARVFFSTIAAPKGLGYSSAGPAPVSTEHMRATHALTFRKVISHSNESGLAAFVCARIMLACQKTAGLRCSIGAARLWRWLSSIARKASVARCTCLTLTISPAHEQLMSPQWHGNTNHHVSKTNRLVGNKAESPEA